MSTVYGTGTALVDYEPLEGDLYSVMQWFTFFWIPLFPLAQLTIRPGTKRHDWGGGKFGTIYDYHVLDQYPLDRARVMRQYVHSLSGLLAAVIPLTAWIVLCNPATAPQSELANLLGLFSVLWIPAVVYYFQRRSMRLYQAMNLPGRYG